MITLKDLIACPWQDVKEQITELYPEQEQSIKGYELAYQELQGLESIPNDMTICVCEEKDIDGTVYAHVFGKTKDDPDNWCLMITDWREWLGMNIDKESLVNYSSTELLVHILFEMTWRGYSNEEIGKARKKLDDIECDVLQDVNR